ncbi:ZIP family metal transporter [Bacillus mojavensis]|uniref:ZIP family metal transporter n=1 Tax=Bacillus mojavensis TaxID=72360 RepID=UPI002DB93AC0|nr:ZIP family metal transporter [Bacillus mojavensis]MEC1666176.1 ZIP family metal transporter [Bacillus mojavensis]
MWNAAMWGGISGSAVLLGALASMFLPIRKRIIGYIMAFGTGVLIGAAAYELLEDAVKDGGMVSTGAGFIAGAVVFTLFDYAVSKRGASQRKRSGQAAAGGGGIAIFIGTIMDAVPESIMIGASLLEEQSVSFLLVVAIFISNIPEGLSSTAGMKNSGYSKAKILLLWAAVLMISIFASWSGYYFLDDAPEEMMSAIAAFAGGGIIAMIASTMMPEAYEDSGPMTGLIAALGLLTSLILNQFS